jgi:hypothetical protein
LRIPLKAISDSRAKPITIPEGNRSGVGAKRRWHFDVAKTDRNRQAESVRSVRSVRSAAKEEARKQRKGCGERGGSPCPRLSTKRPRSANSASACNRGLSQLLSGQKARPEVPDCKRYAVDRALCAWASLSLPRVF